MAALLVLLPAVLELPGWIVTAATTPSNGAFKVA